jgi:class 3 adenylate cyclase
MESSSRTLVCSVLFLDIAEYSKKAVADQLQWKQAFNLVLGKALEQVAPRDRIILDTGDGAAVTFMGDPEDALFAAMSVRDMATTVSHGERLPVRLGVNLGPVRLVKDLNGQMNIIGDGINVAQRVMSFARPGQLLVSRSFYEVVSCLSRDYTTLFRHEGSRTDKHVREHEVYSVGGAPAARRVAEAESAIRGGGGLRGWLARTGPLGMRRSALVAAPALFFAFFGAALALNAMSIDTETPHAERPRAAAAPRLTNASDLLGATEKRATAAAQKPVGPSEPKADRAATAAAQPPPTPAAVSGGRVVLAIAPWGEVIVDGKSRGVSPPIQVLDLPSGPHTVEIRNGNFPARVERIVVKPGQSVRIRHRFR